MRPVAAIGGQAGREGQAVPPWLDRSATPFLSLTGLSKSFGAVAAVDNVSLDIYEGEFFALLGPSGCGKTTLMRMIAGFETPDRGDIRLGGLDLAGVPPHRRPVNMMFQSYALFPHMDVWANVAFGLRQDGLKRDEIDARVAEMLRLVQMQGFERRKPDRLSGGQKQRVALARALARRPKLLLLDEPLAALDRKLREETQFELMDIQARLGTTFLVVTHDQDEAMAMASRIAVMEKGRIAQLGTPRDIYEHPANRAVAAFIGDVNLIEGEVASGQPGAWRIACAALGHDLFSADGTPLSPGQAVTLAVRPERIGVHPGGEGTLSGEIAEIGYLGDWTTCRVRLSSELVLKVARANTGFSDELRRGARVGLAIAPDAVRVLTA
jgi:putrescine transport system ATP-binding protein